jgi:aryl-alcohol dehydrogenase-like predicted oxidoreductase
MMEHVGSGLRDGVLTMMQYRKLGRTGITVSEIGFGAWGIGGRTAGQTSYGVTDDAISRNALARALDLGITFYDTAPPYGDGHSEKLIGSAFRGCRSRVVLATKVGVERFGEAADLSPRALRHSLEGSLRRLGSDHVDLLQIHSLEIAALRRDPAILETLNALVAEGKTRALAMSAKSPADAVAAVTEFGFKVVQINLNMMDLRAQQNGFLALAEERGIGIIARTPLCFGFLSGAIDDNTRFPEGDHRNGWSRAQVARWIEGAAALHDAVGQPKGQSRAQVALRFCLAYPAVASVIPGILTAAEADENAAASAAGPLPLPARARVEEINRLMDFFAPRPAPNQVQGVPA